MDIYPIQETLYPARSTTYTGTAGTTSTWPVLDGKTGGVWIWTTTDAYVIVGEGVTATTSNGLPIPAYTPVTIPIPQSCKETFRVSAIQATTGGTVYAKPVAGN